MRTRITQLQVACAEILKEDGPRTPAYVAAAIGQLTGNVHRSLRCMERNGYAVAVAGEAVSYALTKKGELVVLTSEASYTLSQKRYAENNPLPLFDDVLELSDVVADDVVDDEFEVVADDTPVLELTDVSIRTVSKITVGTALTLLIGDTEIALSAEDARDLYKKLQPYVGYAGSLMEGN